MKARIKFVKYGVMKFIGHLDIMRYYQKIFRRAEVDIAYSQGFSHHQQMSFAAPLGVGLTSDGEYLDVVLNSCTSSEDMIDRINEQMVEGIKVVGFTLLADKSKNSMSLVNAADYLVSLKDEYYSMISMSREEFISKLNEFYYQNEIKIVKKSKKSEKEVDIKPLIYDISFDSIDYEKSYAEKYNNDIYLKMRLACGSEENLKPELVMEAFCNFINVEFTKFAFQYHRIDVFALDNDILVPLSKKDTI